MSRKSKKKQVKSKNQSVSDAVKTLREFLKGQIKTATEIEALTDLLVEIAIKISNKLREFYCGPNYDKIVQSLQEHIHQIRSSVIYHSSFTFMMAYALLPYEDVVNAKKEALNEIATEYITCKSNMVPQIFLELSRIIDTLISILHNKPIPQGIPVEYELMFRKILENPELVSEIAFGYGKDGKDESENDVRKCSPVDGQGTR